MSNQPNLRVAKSRTRRMRLMSIDRQVPVGAETEDYGLSSLEKRIIALLLAGYTTKESAREIGVSERSVRRHLSHILAKLGVSNRLELLLFATHHRLIDPVQASPHGTEKKASVSHPRRAGA